MGITKKDIKESGAIAAGVFLALFVVMSVLVVPMYIVGKFGLLWGLVAFPGVMAFWFFLYYLLCTDND